MKPDFSKVAASRISNAVSNPQVPRAKAPATTPKTASASGPTPISTNAIKPGNRFGTLKPKGTKPTPKPFQPGFTAGKSGKTPGGLAKAAEMRMKNRGSLMGRKGVKWMRKAK